MKRTNSEIIKLFEEWLQGKDKDEKTVTAYVSAITKIEAEHPKSFEEIDINDVPKYMNIIKGFNLSQSTVNSKYLQPLRHFLTKFLPASEINMVIAKNPQRLDDWLVNRKVDKRRVVHHPVLPPKEFLPFKNFIINVTRHDSRLRLRRKTMALLFLTTGLRRDELLNLKFSDFDFERRKVTPNVQKFNKFRTVGVQEDVLAFVKMLQRDGDSEYLFITKTGEQMADDSINSTIGGIVNMALRHGVISVRITPHGFRGSLATYLFFEKEYPIEIISEILGHEDTKTTRVSYIDSRNANVTDLMSSSDFLE